MDKATNQLLAAYTKGESSQPANLAALPKGLACCCWRGPTGFTKGYGATTSGLARVSVRPLGLLLVRGSCFKRADLPAKPSSSTIPRNRRSADWQTDHDTLPDPEFYRRRLVIERLNATRRIKTFLVRYEISLHNWLVFHWLAYWLALTVLLLRKIAPPPTS